LTNFELYNFEGDTKQLPSLPSSNLECLKLAYGCFELAHPLLRASANLTSLSLSSDRRFHLTDLPAHDKLQSLAVTGVFSWNPQLSADWFSRFPHLTSLHLESCLENDM